MKLNVIQFRINKYVIIIKMVMYIAGTLAGTLYTFSASGQDISNSGISNSFSDSSSIDLFTEDEEADVLIYPNPSRSVFNFRISNIPTNDNELCIYNSFGKCISKFKGTENNEFDYFSWNATNMEEGIYYYQYRSGKFYKTGTLRLIK